MTDLVLPVLSCNAIEELVLRFRRASLSRAEWTHDAHLVVAIWHALRFPPAEALRRMRVGITHLNAVHGVAQTPNGGYHETLTRVYMHLVRTAIASLGRDETLDSLVASIVEELRDRTIPLRYYRRETLMSWEARTQWVPPDLQPLPRLRPATRAPKRLGRLRSRAIDG